MPLHAASASSPGFNVAVVLKFTIRWTECLHGEGSLRRALIDLSDLALAEVVHLHRDTSTTGAQRTIATVDRSASQGARPLTRAHGMALAGPTLSRAKPGTLWSMRELDRDAAGALDARVLAWMEARGLREALLIPLSSSGETTDVLECFLSAPLDRPRRQALEMLAEATAEAWGRRPKGRIARILRAAPAINERLPPGRANVHPLSESNPLGLTPAELRLCCLIQRGVDLAEASRMLGITDSTLRSHLRSTFAKFGVAGQVGLVRLLLEPQAERTSLRVSGAVTGHH
jgi:DNA-binding CsgD family transcriptional regulator